MGGDFNCAWESIWYHGIPSIKLLMDVKTYLFSIAQSSSPSPLLGSLASHLVNDIVSSLINQIVEYVVNEATVTSTVFVFLTTGGSNYLLFLLKMF